MNEITPWIDGGLMYGTTKAWADALRSFKNGRLADNSAEGEPQFPQRNTIGLPFANPPNPAEHMYRDAKRYFSKLSTLLLLFAKFRTQIFEVEEILSVCSVTNVKTTNISVLACKLLALNLQRSNINQNYMLL